jgi:hypothetical protein
MQIVAESVVSAYIREIAPTPRSRERARAARPCAESPRTIARSTMSARTRRRALAPRRRALLEPVA